MRAGDIADGPASRGPSIHRSRSQTKETHTKLINACATVLFPSGKSAVRMRRRRYDCETTLSLWPLGRPAASYDADGVRFPSAESSCDREKKSSSPSYGDGPELI